MPIRVAIADDDALIRDSLKIILELDPEIEVVGTCANGNEALIMCQTTSVDVLLMDIRMPVCDGIQGTKMINEARLMTKVLILTTFQDDDYIFHALKNGAQGYMLKNTPSDKIREQIKLVHDGTMLINSEVAQKLAGILKKNHEPNLSGYNLTPREIEIIRLVGEGLSNREIAGTLFLGESTVKNHISVILNKLDLRDRTQLAVFYLRR